VQAQGEVVTKDELMTRVWPGLVVDENTIRVHVSALRKALDEGTSGQTHLMTVPGRGYRLVGLKPKFPAAEGGPDGASGSELSEKPSIAVLPFQNMSGDPEQEYFADGMVDEILTGLSRIKWLSVISRNSTFIYKNKPVAIREIANKFGIRYCSKAACASRGTGFGSRPSSSTQRRMLIFGPSNMTAYWRISSPFRMRSPCA